MHLAMTYRWSCLSWGARGALRAWVALQAWAAWHSILTICSIVSLHRMCMARGPSQVGVVLYKYVLKSYRGSRGSWRAS